MQFTPNGSARVRRIALIDKVSADEVLVRQTGREEVELPLHTHGRHQLIYILSGTLHVEAEGVNYFVTDRHLVWIPSGVSHRLSSNNRQIELLVHYFCADGVADDRFAVYGTDELIARNLQFIGSHRRINRERTPELFAFAVGFFCLLPRICPRAAFPDQPFVVARDSRLIPVLEYVRTHLQQELTIGTVAARFGFSVRNLTRLFTASGIRFVHYLNYQRVVRAIEILTDGTMNVEQTAYEVGFNSPNSFSRVFKHITGESPSRYIRKP